MSDRPFGDLPGPPSPLFAGWDARSAVRTAPRRVLGVGARRLYSPAATPFGDHPALVAAGPVAQGAYLARELVLHLGFTVVLEQRHINPVLARLSAAEYDFAFPAPIRADAYRIYCDEAYHALFAVDLAAQAAVAGGVSIGELPVPAFVPVLRRVAARAGGRWGQVAELGFAVVSETLISGALSIVPSDPTVAGPVRAVIADHARDERRHHAYFRGVFHLLWPQLTSRHRLLLSMAFGDFVVGFLGVDLMAEHAVLSSVLDRSVADRMCGDTDWLARRARALRRGSAATVRMLAGVGGLDDHRVRRRFVELGLVP